LYILISTPLLFVNESGIFLEYVKGPNSFSFPLASGIFSFSLSNSGSLAFSIGFSATICISLITGSLAFST